MKLDIHAHILPQNWPSLKDKYGYGGFITLDHHKPGSAKMMRDDGVFLEKYKKIVGILYLFYKIWICIMLII